MSIKNKDKEVDSDASDKDNQNTQVIPLNDLVRKSMNEADEDNSDKTEEIDQITEKVLSVCGDEDNTQKVEVQLFTPPTEDEKEEEKIPSGLIVRRSDRKRRRKQDDYVNGAEFDSSCDDDEDDDQQQNNDKKSKDRQFSGVMLAHNYTGEENIDGWIMSEKLDGVRCIWNGKTMRSRNNNFFYPPKFFIKDFPDEILDGELFLRRGAFEKTVSIVRKSEAHDGWKDIKFMIFDGPRLGGTFRNRLKKLRKIFENNPSPYIELHKHYECKDKDYLNEEMEKVVALGGEGVIIRDPESQYESTRSDKMLKVKQAHDSEAVVLGKVKGTGRCSNMMGALLVRNNEGIEFKIGSGFTDADRRNPPKIGSIVTYKYYELTKNGKPRFPIYLRPYQAL